MKTKRYIIIWLLAIGCLSATAQRRLVTVDVETRVPVSGANVVCGPGLVLNTDSAGFVDIPDSCASLAVTHVSYESRLINTNEIGDTLFLISKELSLKEVVVFGSGRYRDDYKALRKQLRLQKSEAQLAAIDPASGGNLLPILGKLVPKRWLKNTKKERRKRLKQILDEY